MGLVRRGVHLSCYDGPADDRIILECLSIDIDTVMNTLTSEVISIRSLNMNLDACLPKLYYLVSNNP